MRSLFGAFGLVCGAIAVILVARYGFKTTDGAADAYIMAFVFGTVAVFGLAGHAFALRLWRYNRPVAFVAGLVATCAIVLNLTNSLGAIASRGETSTVEREAHNLAVASSKAELETLEARRAELPAISPVTAGTVEAAKTAATSAKSARLAECDIVGPICRKRQAEEAAANAELVRLEGLRAITARAEALEAAIQAETATLRGLGPEIDEHPQGAAIAALFALPSASADRVGLAQQFGLAAAVELIILVCLVGWEAMGPRHSPAPASSEPIPLRAQLVPQPGASVNLADCFTHYALACRLNDQEPVAAPQFIRAMVRFCEASGIRYQIAHGAVQLLDVALANDPKRLTAPAE